MIQPAIGHSHKATLNQPLLNVLQAHASHNTGNSSPSPAPSTAAVKAEAARAVKEEAAEAPAQKALEKQSSTKVTISATAKAAAAKEEDAETPFQRIAEAKATKKTLR